MTEPRVDPGAEPTRPPLFESDADFWRRRGHKTAAFLLVIPGATVLGYGIGLLAHAMIPWAIIGLGAGLLLWGVIVALTR